MTPFQRHLKESLYIAEQTGGGDEDPGEEIEYYVKDENGGIRWAYNVYEDANGNIWIFNEETGEWVREDTGDTLPPKGEEEEEEGDPLDDYRDPVELDKWQRGYNEFFTDQILQWIKDPVRDIRDVIDTVDTNYPPKPMFTFPIGGG